VPFDQATIEELYPTHGAYVRAVTRDVHDLIADRFLARADGQELIREAAASDIPDGDNATADGAP